MQTKNHMATHKTTPIILDGGMGRELERIGAPFRQPEWSALALMESPEAVIKAHQSFVNAGADVITTNAYALVPFHIGEDCFTERGAQLARSAAMLAKEAVAGTQVQVAGCLPPVLGSYQAQLFDTNTARPLLNVLIENQNSHVDFWLAETISSIGEANLIKQLTQNTTKDCWIAFTISDEETQIPLLRSGETVFDAVSNIAGGHVSAILFNCSKAEVMLNAIKAAKRALALSKQEQNVLLGVYANSFSPNDDDKRANSIVTELRGDLTPARYAEFTKLWLDNGASIIGGCCGVSPEHIQHLAREHAGKS